MMNEYEKKAVRELLDSVNIVRGKNRRFDSIAVRTKGAYFLSSGCNGCFKLCR